MTHHFFRKTGALLLCLLLGGKAFSQTATATFNKLRDKINTVHDYIADVRLRIDVSYLQVPQMAGTLYFKAPGKLRLERRGGLSILPKKNINLSLNSLLPTGPATIVDAGYDSVQGRRVHIIKVIPEGEADIVLAKLWVDEARLLALRTETTTRENGTVRTDLEWGRYTAQGLPDRVTMILDVKDFKLPKGATMDYDDGTQVAPKSSDGKSRKGKIQIDYRSYQINVGVSDAVFGNK